LFTFLESELSFNLETVVRYKVRLYDTKAPSHVHGLFNKMYIMAFPDIVHYLMHVSLLSSIKNGEAISRDDILSTSKKS